ncbi:AraC family transcriptional regulator [Stieleria sp. TO1_6]|uniref:helix-turn-helix domain-containing protein n=1 Tax=Stieleria tagensis TaxID=2956795 RepID=UPI00209B6118|nr:AraC family transcriptional regulator [Stieleria tagensis]MCO8122318.1 AraC family transcriptional regulator [Stieleria tagensis]
MWTGRWVKELFGVTAAPLILQWQIDSAAKAVHESQRPIVAVSIAPGDSDQSEFTHQFHKTFEMTPGDFRLRPSRQD